ncbi:MAG: RluA family pseudouridine synthase [Oscillospiraceae bacterium]|nr:RluA family pseudouridine synthase [Oscillospiraceae bacterium]
MVFRYTVPASEDGRALKSVLRGTLRLSAAQLRRLKAADALSVNGERAFPDRQLHRGDEIILDMREPAPAFPPEEGPLAVLFEDEHLLALDKPQGIILHPTHSRFTGTLANLAWGHIRASGGDGCHAVNRLDRDTGGVVLFAKNGWACSRMSGAVEDKRYVAAVCGVPEAVEGSIDFPIRRLSDTDMKRVCAPDGQSARTGWRLLACRDGLSLLELRLFTGRTHQIRVHCAAMGWPLLGDRLYGTDDSLERSGTMGQTMQALWCTCMTFRHPLDGRPVTLSAKPAEEILRLFGFSA